MTTFAESARTLLDESPWLGVGAVLLGGVSTAANPCSLASVPVLIGLVGGQSAVTNWRRGLITSLVFVAGLAGAFSVMALLAVSAGSYFGVTSPYWPWIIAVACLAAAAQFWDLWHLKLPARLTNLRPVRSGLPAALGMGVLFGIISAPCAAPVLVIVLTYVASKASLAFGLMLLWVYAFGHCALVVIAGTSVGLVKKLLASERYSRANLRMRRAAGAVVACAGLYLVADQLRLFG